RSLGYAALAVALGGTWLLPGLDAWATVLLQGTFMLVGTAGVLVLLRQAAPPVDEVARATLARELAPGGTVAGDTEHSPNPIWGYALEPDKAHFASARWPGGVAYRVCAGVALAVGEPI